MTMTAARAAHSQVRPKPLPEHIDLDGSEYSWAYHVDQRCQERNISPFEVVATIKDPEIVQPYRHGGPGEMSYFRGDLRVGFIPATRVITTVMSINGDHIPRTPLIPQDRMALILKEKEMSAPVIPVAPTREACLNDWLENGTSTDPAWEAKRGAFKPEPGAKFTGRSYIDFYLHKLGGKVTENSLRLVLSEYRNKGKLVNHNNDPSLDKGTWMVPKVPKGETGGVVVTMKPKATVETKRPASGAVKATAQKKAPVPVSATGGFGKPTIKDAKRLVRSLIAQIQDAAEEQGVKVFVNDEGSQVLVSVRWSETKS